MHLRSDRDLALAFRRRRGDCGKRMAIGKEATNSAMRSEAADAVWRPAAVRSIPTMRPCCGGMKQLIEQQGCAGFSLDIVGPASSPAFAAIRFAGYREEEAGQVLDMLRWTALGMALKLESRLPIRRCPYCGYSLRRMLAGTKKGPLRRLVDWIRASSGD